MTFDDDPAIDPKDAAILRSAFTAFARYGMQRTSMADIAAGAGMSRTALYLHYAGKEDIFNALVRHHFDRSEKAVARVLATPGPLAETLLATFHAIDGEAVEAMLNSPHADEILSAKSPFTQSHVVQTHDAIIGHIARWIEAGVADGRMRLDGLGATAAEVASTMLVAKFGVKATCTGFADYRAAEARLAAIFARALGP